MAHLAANRSAPSRPSPSLDGQDDVAEVALERVERVAGRGRGGDQARQDRGHGRVGRGGVLGRRQRLVDELVDAGSCSSAVSVWNRRPAGRPGPTSVSRAASSTAGQPLEPAGDAASRSASGANSRASSGKRPSPSR